MTPSARHGALPPAAQGDALRTLSKNIQKCLGSNGLIDQPLCAKIRTALGSIGPYTTVTNPTSAAEYDKQGTEIWNAATRLQRSDDSERTNATKVQPLLRSFALALIHLAHQFSSSSKPTDRSAATIRVLRTSLKAAKTCIDSNELDLATEIIQRAADYVDFLTGGDRRKGNDDEDPVNVTARELSDEYWTIRAALSWKLDRLDMAVTYFAKVDTGLRSDPTTLEKLADLAYEIGRDLLKNKKAEEAARWLDRASDAIEGIEKEQLSPDSLELRTAILADLVRALMVQKTDESLDRAGDILSYLESETATASRLGLYLLRFQMLEARSSTDTNAYNHTLKRMIQNAVLTIKNFKTIMFHIQKLHHLEPTLAQELLTFFMTSRLYENGEMDLIEKATIMRIWSAFQGTVEEQAVQLLEELLGDILSTVRNTFSEEATHAAQTLLWRSIEAASAANRSVVAGRLCRLASHGLFVKAGDSNKTKIARKTMLNALNTDQLAHAREIFFQMPPTGQSMPASQYLLYRVALRDGDEDTMSQCLSKLAAAPEDEAHYLYACVQEAQRLGSKRQAIAVLQRVLEKFGTKVPSGVHLPALLRCTIQLMLKEAEQDPATIGEVIAQCEQMLRAAVSHFKKIGEPETDDHIISLELEWFAKTSYNIAVQHSDALEPDIVRALLDHCITFTTTLSRTADEQTKRKLTSRALLCHYLSASIGTVLARSADHIPSSEQYYLHVLKHCAAFTATVTTANGASPSIADQDRKISQLLRYEIEALLKTHQWGSLDALLRSPRLDASTAPDLPALADLILSVHATVAGGMDDAVGKGPDVKLTAQALPAVMQAIINASWRREGRDPPRLAKWLRCVFRMTCSVAPETARRIVGQAAGFAAAGDYPPEELEWLACAAFNMGIDRYCAADEEGCRAWAEAALNLARAATGCQGLYGRMQGLWARLREEDGRGP